MQKIKIGQIGVCHEHASGYIQTLRAMPDVFEIVGVVDERPTAAARFAGDDISAFEGLPFLSEEELFAVPGLQAVLVEVPNLELVPTALRCARRGLAIHMDKPAGDDLSLFAELLSACKKRGLPFQMGYMFRNNPAVQWTVNAVRQGWLGDVFEIQADMSHNYGGEPYQDYLASFRGGIMFNLGCHLIDIAVALLGEPSSVVPFLKSAPGDPAHIQNHTLAILEYPHATATIRACSREVDGISRRFKLCGTKGSVDWSPIERFDGQPLRATLALKNPIPGYSAGVHTLDFGIIEDRYLSQLMEFAAIIRGEMQNPHTFEHEYLVQEVLLAASGYTDWS